MMMMTMMTLLGYLYFLLVWISPFYLPPLCIVKLVLVLVFFLDFECISKQSPVLLITLINF